jgi:hypothetical protein
MFTLLKRLYSPSLVNQYMIDLEELDRNSGSKSRMTISSDSAYFSDEVRLPLRKADKTTSDLAFWGRKTVGEDLSLRFHLLSARKGFFNIEQLRLQ